MQQHPNATTAAGGGGLAVFVVWVLGNVFHWSLSAEDGALVAGAIAAAGLFVGRNGLVGLWNLIKHGNTPPKGA